MSREDRIGSSCWYRYYYRESNAYSKWYSGKIRTYSTEQVETTEHSTLTRPVAIIEDDNSLELKVIPVQFVTFRSTP